MSAAHAYVSFLDAYNLTEASIPLLMLHNTSGGKIEGRHAITDVSGGARLHAARYAALAPKRQLRILELGAGTGVAGLFAAKCLEARVVLTDAEDHLELLRDNVRRNNLGERVSVQLFDWKDEKTWDLTSEPDLILCTDNAYHPSLYEPLAAALERCLAGGAKGLFGVTKTDTSFAFFELLTARGLDYRFAEAPADDYYALLAICKAPAFDGRRDAWEMRP